MLDWVVVGVGAHLRRETEAAVLRRLVAITLMGFAIWMGAAFMGVSITLMGFFNALSQFGLVLACLERLSLSLTSGGRCGSNPRL